MKKNGKLYIVPTPIGNLGDITYRAVEILKSVKLIGAEDTRNSGKLLKHFKITTPMFSYHKFNEKSRTEKIKDHLKIGEDIAIISDAGTPGISDPAAVIVEEVIKSDFKVETLPGATAFVPALVSSGLSCEKFYFAGFLPDKQQEKVQLLTKLKELSETIIFYESPHRLFSFLELLHTHFGNRKIVIGREISKLHETYYRADLEEFLSDPAQLVLKGEFVIIVEGAEKKEISDMVIIGLIKQHIEKGKTKKSAVKAVQDQTGINRNRIYQLALKL